MRLLARNLRAFAAVILAALTIPSMLSAHGAWLGLPTLDLTAASKAVVDQNVIDGVGAAKVGDVIELIAEMPVITKGTLSGPGGYVTFYIPPGVQVVGVAKVDGASPPNVIPVRNATSAVTGEGMPKGWGKKGPHGFTTGVNGWNPDPLPVGCGAYPPYIYTAANCNAGLAYIYGDTGVFYSTRSDTALHTGDGLPYTTYTNGYQVAPTNTDPWASIGGSGATRVHNKWDAVQVNAFGSKTPLTVNGFTTPERTPLTGDGRGPTPYMAGSPVAGPQSGSPLDRYGATGPWNRIKYSGSCKTAEAGPANEAGSVAPETPLGTSNSVQVCTDASGIGFSVSEASPLPANTNAIRIALGGIHVGETHRFMLRLKVTDPDQINVFNFAAGGGDSTQGAAAGQDNPWRYWMGAPANVPVAGQGFRLGLNKKIVAINDQPYTGPQDGTGKIPPDAKIRYRITYANSGAFLQTNVVLSDTLPATTLSVSNFTIVSGPNILPATPTPALPAAPTSLVFQTIGLLPGVVGGAVEFDVQLDGTALPGDVITNQAKLVSAEKPGPLLASVSAVIANADLAIAKAVEVYDPLGEGAFAIPGADVLYTITVTNLGDAVDPGSIVVLDPIPPELTFYRGALGGGVTEPVEFVEGPTPSGLVCCTSDHIRYSTDGGLSFSYLPPDDYDPAITHLKVTPAGAMPAASGAAEPSFSIRFRARIE